MDSTFVKTFTKCPQCGGEERVFEELGKKAIANGTATPEFHFALDSKSGPVIDQKKPLHIGDKPLGFAFQTDVCMKCGTVYATKLQRLEVEVRMPQPPLIFPPNWGKIEQRNN